MKVELCGVDDGIEFGLLNQLKEILLKALGLPVYVGELRSNIPQSAFNHIREQWLARKLVQALTAPETSAAYASTELAAKLPFRQPSSLKLGITSYDLFDTGCNYVVGLGLQERGCAVVSLARLDSRFFGFPAMDPDTLLSRCAAAAVYELGRLLELGVCQHPLCAMRRCENIVQLDLKGWQLCPKCRTQLSRRLASAPLPSPPLMSAISSLSPSWNVPQHNPSQGGVYAADLGVPAASPQTPPSTCDTHILQHS